MLVTVVYFSVSWPLAPLVCVVHTMFRLRSNVLRLTKISMRPIPQTSGIGLWQTLLGFEAWSCVLINCLLVSVSTDQLDYLSCWSQRAFLSPSACNAGEVPMTARLLIAVAAEHVVLALVFVINAAVPEREESFNIRLKKAAFEFKKRYMAETLMEGATASSASIAQAPSQAGLRLRAAANPFMEVASGSTALSFGGGVDYEADWHSGSELSDAYEADTDVEPSARVPWSPNGGGRVV
jgi:hypothetical protein